MLNVAEIDVDTAVSCFNKWRIAEVALAGNKSISLPLCHGWAEMRNKVGDKLRIAAMIGNDTVGVVTAVVVAGRRNKKRVEFAQLYVVPQWRGEQQLNGQVIRIARSLVEHVKNAGLALGAKEASLGVGLLDQVGSVAFWIRRGFKTDRTLVRRVRLIDAPINIADLGVLLHLHL